MKLISEYNETKPLVESKDNGKKDYFIEGVFMQADIKNRNGRVYPKEIMDKEVKRYIKEFVNEQRAFGELGHPEEANNQFRQSIPHDYRTKRRRYKLGG